MMDLFVISTCTCFCNVVGEALLVEISRERGANKTEQRKQQIASNSVSLFFIVRAMGMLTTSFFSGFLLEFLTKAQIFQITFAFPAALMLAAVMLPEIPSEI